MAHKQGRLVREPDAGDRRQEWGTVAENTLRIDRTDAAAIIDALSVDQAGSFNLFYLLRKHYWTAEGAEHEAIAGFLEEAYKRVRDLNDALSIRIVELGGIPPNTPPTIQEWAEVHLEAEDLYDIRPSLEGDLEGYATLIASMRDHITLIAEHGDQATAELLREHLEQLEDDAHVIDQLLDDDTLVRSEVLTNR